MKNRKCKECNKKIITQSFLTSRKYCNNKCKDKHRIKTHLYKQTCKKCKKCKKCNEKIFTSQQFCFKCSKLHNDYYYSNYYNKFKKREY